MRAQIIKRASLSDLPSASGVEIIDGIIYIMGDDTPYLYRLDHNLKLLEKVELFPTDEFSSGRIPKALKPDLECITPITINNNKYLLLMGSGSAENRDKGFLVKLPTKFNKKHVVQPVSFTGLYNLLRTNYDIVGNSILNLEGAATTNQHLFLFNRANNAGLNTVVYFELEEFIVYLTENDEMIPFPKIQQFELPKIDKVPSGFTGAAAFEDKLFITAAAEDTSNPVLDGEVTGSLIGVSTLLPIDNIRGGNRNALDTKLYHSLIEENGANYKGKVESITIHEKDSETKFIAIAVTDDDNGGSELLMLEIDID